MDGVGEFRVAVGTYVVTCSPRGVPSGVGEMSRRAALDERFAMHESNCCCVTVRRVAEDWPYLIIAQGFSPAGMGFEPGLLLVEETHRLFVGAGERILAYDPTKPARLWEDSAEMGFLAWERHGDVVLMAAELELAAWSVTGDKLWTTFVEPPWNHRVVGDDVRVDVMGNVQKFSLRGGPA